LPGQPAGSSESHRVFSSPVFSSTRPNFSPGSAESTRQVIRVTPGFSFPVFSSTLPDSSPGSARSRIDLPG
jgi:hypothetical protein